jgi:hypothetical protein
MLKLMPFVQLNDVHGRIEMMNIKSVLEDVDMMPDCHGQMQRRGQSPTFAQPWREASARPVQRAGPTAGRTGRSGPTQDGQEQCLASNHRFPTTR